MVNQTHGMSGHPLYGSWQMMLQRCENPANKAWKHYGERGIAVCARWHDVCLFIQDIETEIGPRPPGMSLDRVDNDRGYEPGNVRWATQWEQWHNRRQITRGRFSAVPAWPQLPADEEWRPVPGYAGFYEVSASGLVYSMPRKRTAGGVLRIQHSTGGTPVVRLSKYGKVRTVTVASLVRGTFGS